MGFDFETILGILFFVFFVILPMFGRKKKPEDEDAAAPGDAQKRAGEPAAGRGAEASTRQASSRAGQPPAAGGTVDDALEQIRARVREAQEAENARQRGATATAPVQADARGSRDRKLAGGPTEGSLVSGSRPSTVLGRPRPKAGGLGREGTAPDASGRTPRNGGLGREGATRNPAPEGASRGLGREGQPPRRPPSSQRVPGGLGREGVGAESAPLEVTRMRRRSAPVGDEARPPRHRTQTDALLRGAKAAARLDAPVLRTDRDSLMAGMIWHQVLSEPAAKRRLRRTRSRPLRP